MWQSCSHQLGWIVSLCSAQRTILGVLTTLWLYYRLEGGCTTPVRAPSRYYLSRVGRLDVATPGVLSQGVSSGLDQEKQCSSPSSSSSPWASSTVYEVRPSWEIIWRLSCSNSRHSVTVSVWFSPHLSPHFSARQAAIFGLDCSPSQLWAPVCHCEPHFHNKVNVPC